MDSEVLANELLGAVEPHVRPQFAKHVQMVDLERGEVLFSQGSRLDRVYFLTSGLVGILAETPDGETIDSAIIGREGAVGAFEACGSRQFFAEAVVQVPGRAARMSAVAYRELFDASPSLRTALHRYVEQLMSETRQFIVCNSMHDVEARLCRTILEVLDKSRLETVVPLTQHTLARMLGAQRTTAAETLARLERSGVISKRRGEIEIEDRAAIEALACSCRDAIRHTRAAIQASDEPSCEAAIAAE